ncbi:hypothetical protein ABIA24_001765 [Sinorhizobium fredii]|uniref:hypothetical protein n=1 Tax=Rhizobium fredii TaxID=380 RepID=UPI0035148356
MSEVIAIGDEARLASGALGKIISIERFVGLFVLEVDGETVVAQRHQFQPVKWDGDVIGKTGIGVCAKNSSEEVA